MFQSSYHINFKFSSIDGCCRHIAATLFEIIKFQEDNNLSSCTSSQCQWVKRGIPTTEAVEITELQTSITRQERY